MASHGGHPSITFTWHHTIPWNCLRAVWDYLVAGQHWGCVKEYLMIISPPHVEATLSALKKAPAIPFPPNDKLLELLTWQGWNIIEGPGNEYRAAGDDPGERYDRWALSTLSSNQRASLQHVDNVYLAMAKIQANAAAANLSPLTAAADVLRLQMAFNAGRQAMRGRAPIMWNPAHVGGALGRTGGPQGGGALEYQADVGEEAGQRGGRIVG